MLSELYNGFYISEPIGNNAFSYTRRQNKKIYVPPLRRAGIDDLALGNEVVFSEINNGNEKNLTGLANYLLFNWNKTPVFVFDNHNHAFFFWAWARLEGIIKDNNVLVHVDQHKDMRKPESWLARDKLNDLRAVFSYTNNVLNVGNFIQPAVRAGLVDRIIMLDHEASFHDDIENVDILDVDIDIFSDDMRYIDETLKLTRIHALMPKAKVITIATSPFFINQLRAVDYVRKLFECSDNHV